MNKPAYKSLSAVPASSSPIPLIKLLADDNTPSKRNRWVNPFINGWTASWWVETLTIVSLDDRGRITIPQSIRDRLHADRFLVSLEDDGVHLIPVPDPRDAKASIKIPWTMEELEEAQERHVLRRA